MTPRKWWLVRLRKSPRCREKMGRQYSLQAPLGSAHLAVAPTAAFQGEQVLVLPTSLRGNPLATIFPSSCTDTRSKRCTRLARDYPDLPRYSLLAWLEEAGGAEYWGRPECWVS